MRYEHPLIWQNREDGHEELRSTLFDDPFFSSEGGQAECAHVFIDGNHLSKRWKAMGKGCFIIAELGFGTGLNFLETWRQWSELSCEGQKLHFISFEGFPLPLDDFSRALEQWGDLAAHSKELIDKWQGLNEGVNIWQMDERITLEIIVAPIEQGFDRMTTHADAWYLDGFSPSKNPDMWSLGVMQAIASKSNESATVATYSSAGWVRRNLEEAGFVMERALGFGKKRHMLRGKNHK